MLKKSQNRVSKRKQNSSKSALVQKIVHAKILVFTVFGGTILVGLLKAKAKIVKICTSQKIAHAKISALQYWVEHIGWLAELYWERENYVNEIKTVCAYD